MSPRDSHPFTLTSSQWDAFDRLTAYAAGIEGEVRA